MANRKSGSAGSKRASAARSRPSTGAEQRLLELAEQLGRLIGTVQTKAGGLLDNDALSEQIVSVRDSATELLAQVRGTATAAVKEAAGDVERTTGVPAPSAGEGRSGGMVDAPGKKHRKPLPSDPGAVLVDSQSAKMRTAMPMTKTPRRRGRG